MYGSLPSKSVPLAVFCNTLATKIRFLLPSSLGASDQYRALVYCPMDSFILVSTLQQVMRFRGDYGRTEEPQENKCSNTQVPFYRKPLFHHLFNVCTYDFQSPIVSHVMLMVRGLQISELTRGNCYESWLSCTNTFCTFL